MFSAFKSFYKEYVAKGLPPILLGFFYVLVSALPIIFIAFSGVPARDLPDEFATQFGLLAYIWIILSFLLSGRFKSISGKIGIDKTIRFHQFMAIILGVFIFIHPYLYTLPISNPFPWDNSRQFSLVLTSTSLLSGMIAWIVVLALIIMSLFRDKIELSYETWRLLHGLGAIIVVAGGSFHVFEVGRYTEAIPALKYLWIILIALGALTILRTYLILPFIQNRHPFKIIDIKPAAEKTWHLTIKSKNPPKFNFNAGQFAWIKLTKKANNIHENPFSISSAPSDLPNIRFTIKEAGDMTNNISRYKKNDLVYVDGPHGHFVIDDRNFDGILMIAGGIGVAPMISIIKEMAYKKDQRPVKLLYGNRHQNQIAFKDELTEASKHMNLNVDYVLSKPPQDWDGKTGIIDTALTNKILKEIDKKENWLFLLCGPPKMIVSTIEALKLNGIKDTQIEFEKFSYFS